VIASITVGSITHGDAVLLKKKEMLHRRRALLPTNGPLHFTLQMVKIGLMSWVLM